MNNIFHSRPKRIRKTSNYCLMFALLLAAVFLTYYSGFYGKKAEAAPASTIYLDPTPQTVNQNQAFTLSAKINPSTNQVYGVDVYVTFDPTKVTLTSIAGNTAAGGFPVVMSDGKIDNTAGKGSISLITAVSASPPVITTTTTVATFTFQAVGSGSATVSFDNANTIAVAQNESANVITAWTPAQITISGATQVYTITDFQHIVANWLQTNNAFTAADGDINGDKTVNTRDLGIVMHSFQ